MIVNSKQTTLGAWDIMGTVLDFAKQALPALPGVLSTVATLNVQKQQLAIQRAEQATRQAEAAALTAAANAKVAADKAQPSSSSGAAAATNYLPLVGIAVVGLLLMRGK